MTIENEDGHSDVVAPGLSRSALYGLATKHRGLFKKAGSATIVDLNMLADIIAELPDADINISASKPDAA